MTIELDYEQMARIVNLVCDVAGHEHVQTRAAVLWTVRNRLQLASIGGVGQDLSKLSQALREDMGCKSEPRRKRDVSPFSDPLFCSLFGTLCGVIASDIPDPSGGAVRFHRHDTVPAWSKAFEPSALIGSYFFYNDAVLCRQFVCSRLATGLS